MATVSGTAVFYAVLVAPGFISVMTTISLSAIEDDLKQFVLLVWSLVTSLVIDTVFLTVYQWRNGPVTGIDELSNVFFQPQFRADYVAAIFVFSVVVGIIYSAGILVDIPGKLRAVMQSWTHMTYTPEQPWERFMEESGKIRIKTGDDQLYMGDVVGWSRAQRPREVRVADPERYYNDEVGFEAVGDPELETEMLFLDDDVDRVVRLTRDGRLTLFQRLIRWLASFGGTDETDGEDPEE